MGHAQLRTPVSRSPRCCTPPLHAVRAAPGRVLEGKVGGTQTRLQDAIADGSKTIGCAPKETALAEANVKFAEEALKMGEYYRGKEHVMLAGKYTEIAELKTDPVRCRAPGNVTAAAAPDRGRPRRRRLRRRPRRLPRRPRGLRRVRGRGRLPRQGQRRRRRRGRRRRSRTASGSTSTTRTASTAATTPRTPTGSRTKTAARSRQRPGRDPRRRRRLPERARRLRRFEDEDGCPEPDNDGDGFLDKDDACPNDPEDFDGDQDEDGCPDPAAKVDPCAIKLDDKVMFDFGK